MEKKNHINSNQFSIEPTDPSDNIIPMEEEIVDHEEKKMISISPKQMHF